MFTEHPEAGTPDGTPDGSENAGTPEPQDGSEAGEAEGEIKPVDGKLAMTWKAKAERVNVLEAEVERLRAEREARTTTDNRGSEATPARDDLETREREIAEEKESLAWLKQLADGGDAAAKAVYRSTRANIRAAEESLASEMRQVYRLEMMDVPVERREAVKALMSKTPALKSPALALRFLKGDEHETQAQEIVRLRKENEELKRPSPRPETPIRGGSKANGAASGIPHIPRSRFLEMLEADPHKATSERGKKFIVDYE